jgi:hypothetical protein
MVEYVMYPVVQRLVKGHAHVLLAGGPSMSWYRKDLHDQWILVYS